MFKLKSTSLFAALAALLLAIAPAASAQTGKTVGGATSDDPSLTAGPWLPPTQSSGRFVMVQKLNAGVWSDLGAGALVSANWVVLPAHLVSGISGSVLRVRNAEGSATATLSKIVVHPSYNQATIANDVAVIKLSAAPFTYVGSTIPTPSPNVGTTLKAVGHVSYVAGTHPVLLQVASTTSTTMTLTPAAGYPNEKGYMAVDTTTGMNLYGMFSYNAAGTQQVYVKLSAYLTWIQTVMASN